MSHRADDRRVDRLSTTRTRVPTVTHDEGGSEYHNQYGNPASVVPRLDPYYYLTATDADADKSEDVRTTVVGNAKDITSDTGNEDVDLVPAKVAPAKVHRPEGSRSSASEYGREFSRAWTKEQKDEYEQNAQTRLDRKNREFRSQPLEWRELSEELHSLLDEVANDDAAIGDVIAPEVVGRESRDDKPAIDDVRRPVSQTVRKVLGMVNGDELTESEDQRSEGARSSSDIFVPFGVGNTSSSNPDLYMKTHNVKAPFKGLVPFTVERVQRARQYDEQRKLRQKRYHERAQAERFANLKRKEPVVDNKTEYQRQYPDWRNYVQSPSGQWVKKSA